jgi:pimeloyl-ACP methyl ester carboxylesterase
MYRRLIALAGFTFSDPVKTGPNDHRVPWTNTKHGLCADAVMRAFGYDRYVAQGGDVGSVVARRCAQLFPDRCRSIRACILALHGDSTRPGADLNFLPMPDEPNDSMSEEEKRGIQRFREFGHSGTAYAAMQGVRVCFLASALPTLPFRPCLTCVRSSLASNLYSVCLQTIGAVLCTSPIASRSSG